MSRGGDNFIETIIPIIFKNLRIKMSKSGIGSQASKKLGENNYRIIRNAAEKTYQIFRESYTVNEFKRDSIRYFNNFVNSDSVKYTNRLVDEYLRELVNDYMRHYIIMHFERIRVEKLKPIARNYEYNHLDPEFKKRFINSVFSSVPSVVEPESLMMKVLSLDTEFDTFVDYVDRFFDTIDQLFNLKRLFGNQTRLDCTYNSKECDDRRKYIDQRMSELRIDFTSLTSKQSTQQNAPRPPAHPVPTALLRIPKHRQPPSNSPKTKSLSPPTRPRTVAPTRPKKMAPTRPTNFSPPTRPSTAAPTRPSTAAPARPSTAAPTRPSTAVPTRPKITRPSKPNNVARTRPSTGAPPRPNNAAGVPNAKRKRVPLNKLRAVNQAKRRTIIPSNRI
jgi:hypothetical protein